MRGGVLHVHGVPQPTPIACSTPRPTRTSTRSSPPRRRTRRSSARPASRPRSAAGSARPPLPRTHAARRPLLVGVGTRAADEQVKRLRGVDVIRGTAEEVARRGRRGTARRPRADRRRDRPPHARRARRHQLEPIAQIHHGAVQCRTPDGRHVVIRPGSFGGPDSLVADRRQHADRGDHGRRRRDRPGDRRRRAQRHRPRDGRDRRPQAARAGGRDPRHRPAAQHHRPRPAARRPPLGRGLSGRPARPPTATSSARRSSRSRNEVDAICTAPINKAALHAAGHKFPGHTELLAHLTGTDEVSMMLSTPKVKVIHVTTHIGLLDAIERIEPGLVERTIRRGHAALGPPQDRRLRHQPPRRRGRAVRPRRGGDEDRAGDRERPARTASTPTARSPPTPRSSSPAAATTT